MKITNSEILVIGSGSWGCAIASVIVNNGYQVLLYTNNEKSAQEINSKHICLNLGPIKLPKSIIATTNLKPAQKAEFIFIAVPSKSFYKVITDLKKVKINDKSLLIICSKGIEGKKLKLFSQIIKENFSNGLAVLSGPNFAKEVVKKIPTITTVASEKKATADKISKLLSNDYFLPIYSPDPITTQISGSIKNILAIGCGMTQGLKLGDNTRAAIIVQGIKEIILLSEKLGGNKENFFSAAGFGDLFLTCSSKKSRNNLLGIHIGKGGSLREILKDKNKTYEGLEASMAISAIAKKYKINLPLCETINNILHKNIPVGNLIKILLKN